MENHINKFNRIKSEWHVFKSKSENKKIRIRNAADALNTTEANLLSTEIGKNATYLKINDYKTCCLKEFNSQLKYEDVLLRMIETFFLEYEMILKKEYNKIIDKFKNNMKYLGETINILLPNDKKQKVFLKNLNFDGSILIENDGKEESIFSARIVNDIN